MNSESSRGKTSQRLVLVAIALVFFLPIAASWVIYNFTDIGKSEKAGSYGELIEPPPALADADLFEAAESGTAHRLHGKWSLAFMPPAGECDKPCRNRLDELTGIRALLGKDTHRVQIVLVAGDGENARTLQHFLQSYSDPRLLIYRPAEPGLFGAGNLYLIDPLGNLMMKYSVSGEAEGIIRDLKRLLRYSRIG